MTCMIKRAERSEANRYTSWLAICLEIPSSEVDFVASQCDLVGQLKVSRQTVNAIAVSPAVKSSRLRIPRFSRRCARKILQTRPRAR
jgi:hypothetical protein